MEVWARKDTNNSADSNNNYSTHFRRQSRGMEARLAQKGELSLGTFSFWYSRNKCGVLRRLREGTNVDSSRIRRPPHSYFHARRSGAVGRPSRSCSFSPTMLYQDAPTAEGGSELRSPALCHKGAGNTCVLRAQHGTARRGSSERITVIMCHKESLCWSRGLLYLVEVERCRSRPPSRSWRYCIFNDMRRVAET